MKGRGGEETRGSSPEINASEFGPNVKQLEKQAWCSHSWASLLKILSPHFRKAPSKQEQAEGPQRLTPGAMGILTFTVTE